MALFPLCCGAGLSGEAAGPYSRMESTGGYEPPSAGSNPARGSIYGSFVLGYLLVDYSQYGYLPIVWGRGLHGVDTCFAIRKSEGFDSLSLHLTT